MYIMFLKLSRGWTVGKQDFNEHPVATFYMDCGLGLIVCQNADAKGALQKVQAIFLLAEFVIGYS